MSNSSSDDDDDDHDDNKDGRRDDYPFYTDEQKIVAAVWMHERPFNYQTIDDIRNNFLIRFKIEAPMRNTLSQWEKKLFSTGSIHRERNQRPMARLIHVPYVKESLREKPHLTMGERACQLGLSRNILRQILRYDIKDGDLKTKEDGSSGDAVENREVHIKDDVNSD